MVSSIAVVPGTPLSALSSQDATTLSVPPAEKHRPSGITLLTTLLTPSSTMAVQSSSSLPAATSSAPVVIPGQGGLSPCAEYLSDEQGYAPGTENFCFCDGIKAPMLVNTVSGTIVSDCSYTTMPSSGWTPIVTAGYSSPTPPSSTRPPSTNPAPRAPPTPISLGPIYICILMYISKNFPIKNGGTIQLKKNHELMIQSCTVSTTSKWEKMASTLPARATVMMEATLLPLLRQGAARVRRRSPPLTIDALDGPSSLHGGNLD
ncbi:hypothetical protein HO173_011512 [Letharia columbiana]|uniref:Uncharacterized protein n=1 Tax=Letharia columbiana TaxID=112416 RepID=A0A8H6KZ33_9LECA|nr:uncharacterized protein HO173_011512 [Letharia columbiana]KAF6229472.1 hypothetical protein HO173_011512 [Letharia columbiana]